MMKVYIANQHGVWEFEAERETAQFYWIVPTPEGYARPRDCPWYAGRVSKGVAHPTPDLAVQVFKEQLGEDNENNQRAIQQLQRRIDRNQTVMLSAIPGPLPTLQKLPEGKIKL
jgi:hypothetical protein